MLCRGRVVRPRTVARAPARIDDARRLSEAIRGHKAGGDQFPERGLHFDFNRPVPRTMSEERRAGSLPETGGPLVPADSPDVVIHLARSQRRHQSESSRTKRDGRHALTTPADGFHWGAWGPPPRAASPRLEDSLGAAATQLVATGSPRAMPRSRFALPRVGSRSRDAGSPSHNRAGETQIVEHFRIMRAIRPASAAAPRHGHRLESLQLLQHFECASLARELRAGCDVLPTEQPTHGAPP